MGKIRILLIEENRVLRESITRLFDGQADLHIAAATENEAQTFLIAGKIKPQVILVDVHLIHRMKPPIMETIRNAAPDAKLIGMGAPAAQGDIVELIAAGFSGFIKQDAAGKEFLSTVRSVAHGEKILPVSMTAPLFSYIVESTYHNKKEVSSNVVRTTKRESDIMKQIADGQSNKEIGRVLNIATHTVKSHVHNIMAKLALHSRLQIAKFIRDKDT